MTKERERESQDLNGNHRAEARRVRGGGGSGFQEGPDDETGKKRNLWKKTVLNARQEENVCAKKKGVERRLEKEWGILRDGRWAALSPDWVVAQSGKNKRRRGREKNSSCSSVIPLCSKRRKKSWCCPGANYPFLELSLGKKRPIRNSPNSREGCMWRGGGNIIFQ